MNDADSDTYKLLVWPPAHPNGAPIPDEFYDYVSGVLEAAGGIDWEWV